jgi:hypothetical protein
MWRRVALVSTDVSEELIARIIGVTRIGELGTPLAVTRFFSQKTQGVRSQKTAIFTKHLLNGLLPGAVIVLMTQQ